MFLNHSLSFWTPLYAMHPWLQSLRFACWRSSNMLLFWLRQIFNYGNVSDGIRCKGHQIVPATSHSVSCHILVYIVHCVHCFKWVINGHSKQKRPLSPQGAHSHTPTTTRPLGKTYTLGSLCHYPARNHSAQ